MILPRSYMQAIINAINWFSFIYKWSEKKFLHKSFVQNPRFLLFYH